MFKSSKSIRGNAKLFAVHPVAFQIFGVDLVAFRIVGENRRGELASILLIPGADSKKVAVGCSSDMKVFLSTST